MRMARGASRPVYEHPWFVRFTHWTNAFAVTVLALSGMQIFYAFPSFGAKVPQENLLQSIPEAIRLGGWLGGALQWHFTFMWIFALGGIFYAIAQAASGHFRTVVFTPSDVRGVWPMARHYFLFGPKPGAAAQYNPLQKLAYTSAVLLGALLLLTGIVMYKPVQFSSLGVLVGGYHRARLLHFLAMCGLLAFVPGHLVMAIHGWDNFRSMLIGWKMRPEYEPAVSLPPRSTASLDDS
jgi:Ni/Fe-hydrogenase b-type cytochrome subunit